VHLPIRRCDVTEDFDWNTSPLFTGPDDGEKVLNELRTVLLEYVIFPSAAAVDAVTLWIAATHAQRAWNCATRLVIKAPEKRCGKSRLLDVIEATCHKPLITVNISPAALVRSIGEDPPTLLLDEADTVFGKKAADNHEDLRGIVNAGHQRNRPYIRWDPTARAAESCPTFAMAAMAGIGDMPETIEDRAVIVEMRRRSPNEMVRPYRTRRDAPRLRRIGESIAAWVEFLEDSLTDATPDMPIEDRAADNWEPLVAVADAAGGHWPAKARTAALVLVHASEQHDTDRSLGMRLLADVRAVCDGLTFVRSAELVERLHRLEESPWRDYNLTTRQLASRLKQYGVHVGHDTTKTQRGYKLADFVDAWARYLPGVDRPETSERPEPAENLADAADASSASDASIRPTHADPSDEISANTGPSDARTRLDARTLAFADALANMPPAGCCQMCGDLFPSDDPEAPLCPPCADELARTA
jgi:hypothetical protein